MFTCEGLLYYLPPAAVDALLADWANVAAPGASCSFTFVLTAAEQQGGIWLRHASLLCRAVDAEAPSRWWVRIRPDPGSLHIVICSKANTWLTEPITRRTEAGCAAGSSLHFDFLHAGVLRGGCSPLGYRVTAQVRPKRMSKGSAAAVTSDKLRGIA